MTQALVADCVEIASALRTLDAEASGITALAAAIGNGLGDSLLAAFAVMAISPIRNRRE